jgi:hypothetical protein
MRPAPKLVGGKEAVFYSPIDERHHVTANAIKTVATVAGLAICKTGSAFYLFGCDENWNAVTDTYHDSLKEALDRAEWEYEGITATWMTPE